MARVINAIEVALEAALVHRARWSSLIATQLGQSVNQNVFFLIIRDQQRRGCSRDVIC